MIAYSTFSFFNLISIELSLIGSKVVLVIDFFLPLNLMPIVPIEATFFEFKFNI